MPPSLASIPLAPPWPAHRAGGARLMGILNVTPDSFSDGGRFAQSGTAVAAAEAMLEEGADIIDIGGESTRPGHLPVPAEIEQARILPVIEALASRRSDCLISVDTYKASTARLALRAGARIVNDVWGLQKDPALAHVVAEAEAGLVLMHNRAEKDESLDILDDMRRFFARSLQLADAAGIAPARIVLDPGIGFGKSQAQNLAAIRAIPALKAMGFAVLLGVSRKSLLGALTGRPVEARLAGTLAASAFGLLQGADFLRVHDVGAHIDLIRVIGALQPRFEG